MVGDHEIFLPIAHLLRMKTCIPTARCLEFVIQGDSIIRSLYLGQKWFAEKFTDPNPIAGMMGHTGLAHMTFMRRFKRATGERPIDYVHMLRIEKAKKMLEGSNNGVDEIGHEVGYEYPASFRRIFKHKVSLTPGAYRRKFGYGRFDRCGVKC